MILTEQKGFIREVSYTQIARVLGVNPSFISQVRAGTRPMPKRHRKTCLRRFGIPEEFWDRKKAA